MKKLYKYRFVIFDLLVIIRDLTHFRSMEGFSFFLSNQIGIARGVRCEQGSHVPRHHDPDLAVRPLRQRERECLVKSCLVTVTTVVPRLHKDHPIRYKAK